MQFGRREETCVRLSSRVCRHNKHEKVLYRNQDWISRKKEIQKKDFIACSQRVMIIVKNEGEDARKIRKPRIKDIFKDIWKRSKLSR